MFITKKLQMKSILLQTKENGMITKMNIIIKQDKKIKKQKQASSYTEKSR